MKETFSSGATGSKTTNANESHVGKNKNIPWNEKKPKQNEKKKKEHSLLWHSENCAINARHFFWKGQERALLTILSGSKFIWLILHGAEPI